MQNGTNLLDYLEVVLLIEIKLPGQLLLLTAAEMSKLLASRPDIWETALRRGKAMTRARQRNERKPKSVDVAEEKLTEEMLDRCLRD